MKLAFKINVLIILFLQLHPLVNSQAPISGCDAISNEGRCYSYFTGTLTFWQTARGACQAWGGDLATVTSPEEEALMYTTVTNSDVCWFGLNDLDSEGTYVWADGDSSTYRHWLHDQPNDYNANQDCSRTEDGFWNDWRCNSANICYFCSANVSVFGEQNSTDTFTALEDNSVIYRDTNLYCITETKNTSQVTWTHKDLYGVTTALQAITNTTRGISILHVTKDKLGFYSCEVSQNGGNIRTHTVVMLESKIDSIVLNLHYRCDNTFLLLPPAVNRADIPILTQNVILSTNLAGRWQTPDGIFINSDSITIPTLYVSHAGLYKFYVTNWDGEWTLAIQIEISPVVTYTQTLINLKAESTSQNSMLVYWSLSERDSYDFGGIFSVYIGYGKFENLTGTTKELSFEITDLASNINYTVRVALQYSYSAYNVSATTHHLLVLSGDNNPTDVAILGNTDTQPTYPVNTTEFPTNTELSISYSMYTFIVVLVVLLGTILILILLFGAFIVRTMKRNRKSEVNTGDQQVQWPQVFTNEIYQQIDPVVTDK